MRVFREAEMPLLPVLVRMEQNGIRLDVDLLAKISKELELRIDKIEARIHEIAGGPFNIRSTGDPREAALRGSRAPQGGRDASAPRRRAKGTGYATDEATLRDLEPFHELPRLVLEYRHLTKLKSTYVDTLAGVREPGDGRIHTSFHQTGAATGRLSSSDPNLQNIPIRSPRGARSARRSCRRTDWVFLSCDYSQIELRLLAHLSQRPAPARRVPERRGHPPLDRGAGLQGRSRTT